MTHMDQVVATSNGWRKSSLSYANGNCVEVRLFGTGGVQVRNSRLPGEGTLEFTAKEWEEFLAGARQGEFDLPATGTAETDKKAVP